jgi:hypothetical protein
LILLFLLIQIVGLLFEPEAVFCQEPPKPLRVEVRKENGRYLLFRDGKPHYIKGAVYWGDPLGVVPLKGVSEKGGNSVRCGGGQTEAILDEAQKLGISVTLGLPVKGEYTDGFNYDDVSAVQEQFQKVKELVLKYKDHPALLMWGIGNELSLFYKNKKVWEAVNDIARMIHEVDPNHPTMTVTGDDPINREVTGLILEKCPYIDVLGINAYKRLTEVPHKLKEFGWVKPYCITEWGPTGHWEVPKTNWGAEIEETSTEKAKEYIARYTSTMMKDLEKCLGSYVFYWGQKQEKTHTWYGMFLEDGDETESVEVMQYLWTGSWPRKRAPRIGSLTIDRMKAEENITLKPRSNHVAKVFAIDPGGVTLSLQWEFLPEPKVFGYGGKGELRPEPVPDLIRDSFRNALYFRAPTLPGAYRLFVTVSDRKGKSATANIPFLVKGPTKN